MTYTHLKSTNVTGYHDGCRIIILVAQTSPAEVASLSILAGAALVTRSLNIPYAIEDRSRQFPLDCSGILSGIINTLSSTLYIFRHC